MRSSADVERHADRVAGVEARAANLGELPARAQVTRAPLGVRLESPRCKHHGLAFDFESFTVLPHHHPADAVVVRHQRNRARVVPDLDALLLRDLRERIHQARAAAHHLEREPAPELELAADIERLPVPKPR